MCVDGDGGQEEWVGPDPPEEMLMSAFARGDAAEAAKILRELDSLSRPCLETIAELLVGFAAEEKAALQQLFLFRLKFQKWGRGAPSVDGDGGQEEWVDPPPPEEMLMDAFARRDAAEAAKILRELDSLSRPNLENIAGLLVGFAAEEKAALQRRFPFRLKFGKWVRGAPKNLTANSPWSRRRRMIAFFEKTFARDGVWLNAVEDTAKEFKVSITTVRETVPKKRAKPKGKGS